MIKLNPKENQNKKTIKKMKRNEKINSKKD